MSFENVTDLLYENKLTPGFLTLNILQKVCGQTVASALDRDFFF